MAEKYRKYTLTPTGPEGYLELNEVDIDHGWHVMYATLDFAGRLATSVKSSTALFDDHIDAVRHADFLGQTRKDIWIEKVKVNWPYIKIPDKGDLTMPKDKKCAEIAQIFLECAVAVLGERPNTGGCSSFYTPKEWKERGEKYCLNAELIICHDGGDLHTICTYDAGFYTMKDKLDKLLEEKGYYMEQATTWYSGVYKNGDDDESEDSDN